MKALLDTSFFRHLCLIDMVGLIEDIAGNNKWQFFVPRIVINELEYRGVDDKFRRLLENDTVMNDSCTDEQLSVTRRKLPSLDCGELEAICIISKCSDKTFKPYVILTDDTVAQKKATEMEMNSMDVVTFIFYALQHGFLSCESALNAIDVLQNHAYRIEDGILDQFNRACQGKS